ncbi:MAG: alpha-amylase [Fibrella sp.]|nr:alpha-amylase [Armatimonadota bacterium]
MGGYTPSPDAWEDEALYFLLLDRFSDGNEDDVLGNDGQTVSKGERPRFLAQKHAGNAVKSEKSLKKWRESGTTFTGGTLRGLTEKIGYLKRMGVTTVWVSPILKQAPFATNDYHGYGTQDFYEVEPRFGTRTDFRTLVDTAHEHGIKIILDIILNHCCDAFAYDGDDNRQWTGEEFPVKGFRDKDGSPEIPFKTLGGTKYTNGAVWPRELQAPENFTRKGYMSNWDNWPEYEEGDFFGFKDFKLGNYSGGERAEETEEDYSCTNANPTFEPSAALIALTEVYKYWIAYADLDGFRIDTVKHMGPGPACWFANEIKAFTQTIGKPNFFLIGEIAGGRAHAHWMLGQTGLDAALGIDEIPERMRGVVRGEASPCEFFGMFINSKKEQDATENPNWWRNRVVTFFDDHDQVGRSVKGRFASVWGEGDKENAAAGVIRALGFNVTTLGIPCVYYGTEQGFDGHAQDPGAGDRYLRESMHGAAFGSFGSHGAHFFNENSRIYRELSQILDLRKKHATLRRGRQYIRPISIDGEDFFEPERIGDPYQGVVAWSRVLDTDEFVCALNTDEKNPHTVWVTVDFNRHVADPKPLICLYSTDDTQIGNESATPENRNGSAVRITVPAGGFVIYR